jgi:hypothetical protein
MTITNVTDKELQQAQLIAELEAEIERLKAAAKYAEHIDATPENQRETMLHDALTERNALRAQIEASRKQKPVGFVESAVRGAGGFHACFRSGVFAPSGTQLYAAPVVPEDVPTEATEVAQVAIESVLREYNYPANPKNAARAGWRACRLHIAAMKGAAA